VGLAAGRLALRKFSAVLLFGMLGMTSVAVEAQASFEVATVKAAPQGNAAQGGWSLPGIGSFWAKSLPLARLIQLAYGINDEQIAGKPGWFETDLFDVNAKPEDGVKLSREELKPRLQGLLRERFHLETHFETRLQKGYALILAKDGPRLTATKADKPPGWRAGVYPGRVEGKNWSMPFLAMQLGPAAGSPVVDKTGLTGSYDVALLYAADAEKDPGLPSLFTAIRETLGLQLEAQKVPVETLVIDRVDRVPTSY